MFSWKISLPAGIPAGGAGGAQGAVLEPLLQASAAAGGEPREPGRAGLSWAGPGRAGLDCSAQLSSAPSGTALQLSRR